MCDTSLSLSLSVCAGQDIADQTMVAVEMALQTGVTVVVHPEVVGGGGASTCDMLEYLIGS